MIAIVDCLSMEGFRMPDDRRESHSLPLETCLFIISGNVNLSSKDKRQVGMDPFQTLLCQNMRKGSAPRRKTGVDTRDKGAFCQFENIAECTER